MDAAFAGTAYSKVYWIGAIEPHWGYGEKEDDGPNVRPLTVWHDTTHDQAAFDDLHTLARLIAALQSVLYLNPLLTNAHPSHVVVQEIHLLVMVWPPVRELYGGYEN